MSAAGGLGGLLNVTDRSVSQTDAAIRNLSSRLESEHDVVAPADDGQAVFNLDNKKGLAQTQVLSATVRQPNWLNKGNRVLSEHDDRAALSARTRTMVMGTGLEGSQ